MAKKVTKSKSNSKFTFEPKLVFAGVLTYIVSWGFFSLLTYFLDNILIANISEGAYNTIQGGGSAAFEQYMKYGLDSALAGGIAGSGLVIIIIFIAFSEWFNFHKFETYRKALLWGVIWSILFLVTDQLMGFVYSQVMWIISPSGYSNSYFQIITNASPYSMLFLLIVAIIPIILFSVHKLNMRFSK